MKSDHVSTGATVILESLNLEEEGREWKVVYFVVRYSGWFILVFVAELFFLSPELRDPWVYRWLLFYLGYLLMLEIPRRLRRKFYDTSLFRIMRIQVQMIGLIFP